MSNVTPGCLLIADIGGYTRYLTGVELDHSQDILADVLHTVVNTLCGPFELAKLEGDAVFCYQPGDPAPADAVIGIIDETYTAFHDRLRAIRYATSCRCQACLQIPNLTLKFVVHTGEFILHVIAGNKELVGKDVIVVHRLLKNEVEEQHGLKGYALLTDACCARHGIDGDAQGMAVHIEPFDDVGEIHGRVLDLEARLAARQSTSSVRITDADADGSFETSAVPLPPEELWGWLTDASRRPKWQVGIDAVHRQGHRPDAALGTINHCMHGPELILEQIVGWQPYEFYTSRYHFNAVGFWTWTYELKPTEEGTALRMFVRFDEGEEQRQRASGAIEQIRDTFEQNAARLRALLAGQDG